MKVRGMQGSYGGNPPSCNTGEASSTAAAGMTRQSLLSSLPCSADTLCNAEATVYCTLSSSSPNAGTIPCSQAVSGNHCGWNCHNTHRDCNGGEDTHYIAAANMRPQACSRKPALTGGVGLQILSTAVRSAPGWNVMRCTRLVSSCCCCHSVKRTTCRRLTSLTTAQTATSAATAAPQATAAMRATAWQLYEGSIMRAVSGLMCSGLHGLPIPT